VIDGGGLFGRSVTLTPLQRPRPGPNQHDRILVEEEDYNRIPVEQEDYNRILGQQENNQDVVVDGLATRQDDAAMFVSEDAQDGMLLNEENSQASTITRTWSGRFLESYQQDSQEDAGLGLDQEDSGNSSSLRSKFMRFKVQLREAGSHPWSRKMGTLKKCRSRESTRLAIA